MDQEPIQPTASSNTRAELVRYIFVGGFAYLVDLGLFLQLQHIGWSHLWAAPFSYTIGILVNYGLSVLFVFKVRRYREHQWLELALVFFVSLLGLLVNQFFIWLLMDIASYSALSAKLITGFIVLIWNFVGRKILVF